MQGRIAVGLTWGLYFCLLWPRILVERSDGLWAGWRTVWVDWAVHVIYANVFAYQAFGEFFDQNPLYATERLHYPFAADAISGLMMRMGFDLVPSFVMPSIVASLVLVALLYRFYGLALESSAQAWLALTLFFTNGGMGFMVYLHEFFKAPSLEMLRLPPGEYTFLPQHGIEWINIITSEILPQRALLVGLPVTLALLLALRPGWRGGLASLSVSKLMALGALSSSLLLIHTHSYVALVIFCAVFLLFDLKSHRAWLVYGASAALPSLLLWQLFYADGSRQNFIEWYPGWLANSKIGHGLSLPLFLWLNWGVFLPLAAAAVARFRLYRDPLIVAGLLLFVLCFLIRFQPHPWDNTKLLTWAHLILCIPVARYLAHLWRRKWIVSRLVTAMLAVCLTASGTLDLWRSMHAEEIALRMWTREEMDLAADFREISSPSGVVLCSDYHHHWVPSLAGRPILLGFRGWLASYGVDYSLVERDVRSMLAGDPDTERLLRRYNVEFVAIGEHERLDFGARPEYFRQNHESVFQQAGYEVFRVTRPARAADR